MTVYHLAVTNPTRTACDRIVGVLDHNASAVGPESLLAIARSNPTSVCDICRTRAVEALVEARHG